MNDSSPPLPAPAPAPVFVAPPPDPALAILQKQTENQNVEAMKSQSMLDTAHLMQQYGIMNALGGSPASPLSATPAATAPVTAMLPAVGANMFKAA